MRANSCAGNFFASSAFPVRRQKTVVLSPKTAAGLEIAIGCSLARLLRAARLSSKNERTIGIAAGHTGYVNPAHTDLWIAARARDRTLHPGNVGKSAARRAWRSLSRSSAPGRARLDLRKVGGFR